MTIVAVFVVLLVAELLTDGKNVSETIDMEEALRVKPSYKMVTSMYIIIFAYSVQFMVLPTY